MKKARVLVNGRPAGVLEELDERRGYRFAYDKGYDGPPVSLTMPLGGDEYTFAGFPAFFDGLLPEGIQLESLLRQRKIDRDDLFVQLIAVGGDLVGAVTVEAIEP
jgi:serine/threonine-protein kinase HipA